MTSKRLLLALAFAAAAPFVLSAGSLDDLFPTFADPPQSAKPWCYWFLSNTLTDRETISAEYADIARLGFGGILVTDSRGYHVDDDHLLVPPPTMRWGGDEWIGLYAHAVREAAKNGLKFSLNIAASGGHLRGDVDVGEDNPKFLMCRSYLPGDAFERPTIPHYREVAVFAVKTSDAAMRSDWANAGDGYYSMAASAGKRMDGGSAFVTRAALEVRELAAAADGASLGAGWTILRFGFGTLKGQEVDIDVLDRAAVVRHLDRVVGRLIERVPGFVGRDKTFANLYNVSWEGAMPTWSATFEADFKAIEGYDMRPLLPALAGFELAAKPTAAFLRDFRHARGIMMREHLYCTVRDWAHQRGMGAFSESGGPWQRNPQTFGECDMLDFLSANDFPQGEFWPRAENGTSPISGRANLNGRFITKGVVSAAHVFGSKIASAEAFTHMHRHWSVDPAFLKPLGDQAFADGINLLVWHTYTSSPVKYGIPGLEYFAGSHINRNVTWHDEFPAMVAYLARCQALLQSGEPVTDIAVLTGDRAYTHWGTERNARFRNLVSDEMPVTIPRGYAYDTVSDAALKRDAGLLARYAVVYDARPAAKRNGRVDVGGLPPDVETASDFTWCHRRTKEVDIYFVAGEGKAELVFRASPPFVPSTPPSPPFVPSVPSPTVPSPTVEIWDAVTARRSAANAVKLPDGRTKVLLDLPTGGSCFVVFGSVASASAAGAAGCREMPVSGPWRVSFAYPPTPFVPSAPPPTPFVPSTPSSTVPPPTVPDMKMSALVDFSTCGELKYFSGTATYRTTFELKTADLPTCLSLGEVPTGLAHVYVNGCDCGTVWCAPWEADIAAAVRSGRNELEIRYVNNWHNRLVGDCFLPEADRVTRSNLHYWQVARKPRPGGPKWDIRPTVYSGYSTGDALQKSGLLGPVKLRFP